MKFSTLAAAVLALAAGGVLAQTKTYTVGTLPIITSTTQPFLGYSSPLPLGSFLERWNFTFPLTGALSSASTVTLNLNGVSSIGSPSLQLWSVLDNGNLGSRLAIGAQSGQSVTINNFPLTGGASYAYLVGGTTTGSAGGTYALIAGASPVPEPETYALFLAGLAAVGFVARRRNPTAVPQPT